MDKYLFIFVIAVCFVCAFARTKPPPLSDEELEDMKQEWDECCKKYLCIHNSCYFSLNRAATWYIVRELCQANVTDWSSFVDLLEFQIEDDLKLFSELILEKWKVHSYAPEMPKEVWTSGIVCPKSNKKGFSTRWAGTETPFPEWLDEKIGPKVDLKKHDGCKFLMFTPSSNVSEIEYEIQDPIFRHPGVCEFVFPGEIPTTTSYPTTIETMTTNKIPSTNIIDETNTTSSNATEYIPTETHYTIKTKSKTFAPGNEFQNNSSEEDNLVSTTSIKTSSTEATTLTDTTSTSTTTENVRKYCKGKQESGIDWPDTLPGVTVNKSCPEEMTGYAQWTCDKSTLQFTPIKPHVQDCRHIWITDLEEKVDNGRDAVDISSELAEETEKQDMSHGDITALVDLSVKILHLFSSQKEDEFLVTKDKPFKFTGSMVSSMSNMLRAEIKDAWENLPASHQTRAASKILQIVTIIGSHLSCIRNSDDKLQFTVSAENIGLQTFILKKEEKETDRLVFPQIVEGVEANSSVMVPANLVWKKPKFSTCKNYDTAVGVLYKHVGDFLKDEKVVTSSIHIVSKVISFSMNNNTETFALPKGKEVIVTLRHTLTGNFQHDNLICVFWNFSKSTFGEWDRTGCSRVASNDTHTICSCNHLTNFAVLMDVNGNVDEDEILSMMTYICCGMSSCSLVITLICFFSIRSLHGRRSIITGNLCLSLLFTNLLILFGLERTENRIICASIAGFLHFWILSAFCWMLVEGYHLYRMVVLVFERGRAISVKVYYMFAYGVPLLVVGISAGIRSNDYGGNTYCWISSNNGLMWSFVGPACVIIAVNIVVFILTLRSASSVRIKREQTTIKKIKNWTRGSMSVMCLLGLTWCLGLFYIDKKLHVFSYIFTIFNGLQGVFILLFHVILNDKVNSLLHCRGSKHNNWRKCLPQTSSNPLHSKLSTRTSLNSIGSVSCNVAVINPRQASNIMMPNPNSHQKSESMNKSKMRIRRNGNTDTYKTGNKKQKATHTVSENGMQNFSQSRRFKPRSQSFQDDVENEATDTSRFQVYKPGDRRNNLGTKFSDQNKYFSASFK